MLSGSAVLLSTDKLVSELVSELGSFLVWKPTKDCKLAYLDLIARDNKLKVADLMNALENNDCILERSCARTCSQISKIMMMSLK